MRRRGARRAVRRRGHVPAGRSVRPDRRAAGYAAPSRYHPGLEVEPFADQQVADAGDIACNPFDIAEAIGQIEAGAEAVLSGPAAAHDRRRPHDRAAAAPGDEAPARTGRAAALRRAPGHLGHVLRRALHARDAVPPSVGGGPAARGPRRARRDPRPAVLPERPRGRRRASGSRSWRRWTSRSRDRRGRRREAPSAPLRRAGLRLGRHRRARPRARARDRYTRGRRDHQPRAPRPSCGG